MTENTEIFDDVDDEIFLFLLLGFGGNDDADEGGRDFDENDWDSNDWA